LQRAQQIVRARVQSGVMSEYDALRLDVELRGLETEVSAARADVTDQRGQLTVLALMPQLAFVAKGDLLGSDSLEGTLPAARTAPLLAWAKAEEVAAQSEIELARRNAKPVPVAGVGAMFTTSGVALAASLGLAMDLPVFDRGQGAIARAEATSVERQRQREATQVVGTASILRSDKLLGDRVRNARRFDLELGRQLEELRRMGDAAYKSGAGGILSLLDTERTITDARLKQVELHRLAAEARVEALAARGWADSDLP
jgi:cobalt-zinc-cadmium efflux system outer membrane protein